MGYGLVLATLSMEKYHRQFMQLAHPFIEVLNSPVEHLNQLDL